jgi:4-amino-4-deoxy-L-arabinose transferase-like glycosyltransferase/glycosyltransferase involved in cell wall biosynthesis
MADALAPPPWRLSLVIPAYNEEAGIRQAIAEADAALARITSAYEILVVDDGSSDATAAIVAEEARTRPYVRLLRHAVNRGYGAALRTGFEAARFERAAFTDADCQFHLDDLARLLPLTDGHAIAAGYRVGRQDPGKRRLMSWGYNTAVRTLLGTRIRDVDCALKVFRSEALAELLPESAGFFVNTEMLARARQLGYRVTETGVRHRPRVRGSSKVSVVRDVPRVLGALLPYWWARMLFPSFGRERSASAGPGALAERSRLNGLALLLLVAAALLFFARPGTPLQEPQEARFAEVARQMTNGATWVVPALPGQSFADKPPLLPWLLMLNYRLFGVHDWAARLVAGCAGFATVLLTWLWGRRVLGPRAALVGALVLCCSAHFVYLGRLLTTDGLLAACVVAAWAAAHAALLGDKTTGGLSRRWWLVSALACGLGLLTKGPVALALVAGPVLLLCWLDRRVARPSWRMWLVYVTVAVGLAAPWYAAQEAAEPGFLMDFLWRQHVVRFAAPFDHSEPVWYFLPRLALGMLPWTLLLPGLVRFLGRHSPRAALRRPAPLGFILLAFVMTLLLFSASGCKRPTYLLPAMPPLALLLGCYLDAIAAPGLAARAGSALAHHSSIIGYRATQVVLSAGIASSLAAAGAGLLRWPTALFLAACAAAGLLMLRRADWRTRPRMVWSFCFAMMFAMLFTGVYALLPGYARKFSLRGQVRPLAAGQSLPIVSYPRRWDSVSFYLGRDDVETYGTGELAQLVEQLRGRAETLVIVKTGAPLEALLARLPPGMEFVPEGRQGSVATGRVRFRREISNSLYAQAGP